LLDAAQKKLCRSSTIELLKLVREPFDFNGIATGDESWLQYHYELPEMSISLREHVAPDVTPIRDNDWGKKFDFLKRLRPFTS
jgi:hypothetical protein